VRRPCKGTDPYRDTRQKIRAVSPLRGRVLDICTGLGYTAIEAAKTAEEVVTIELDPTALEVARLNPWSRPLFDNPRIRQIVGDAFETSIPASSTGVCGSCWSGGGACSTMWAIPTAVQAATLPEGLCAACRRLASERLCLDDDQPVQTSIVLLEQDRRLWALLSSQGSRGLSLLRADLHQDRAARQEMWGRSRQQATDEGQAIGAAVEGRPRLMVADLGRQVLPLLGGDVGQVGNDQMDRLWQGSQQVASQAVNPIAHAVAVCVLDSSRA